MADVFLSYSREDRERLAPLVHGLESAGLSVFWDRDVPVGSTWRSILDRELQVARAVIVAWSSHSVKSEWVIEEAEDAMKRGCLLSILIDEVPLPIGFRSRQAGDLTNWNGRDDHPLVGHLATNVRARGAPDGSLSPHSVRAPLARTSRPRWPRMALAATGTVALLGAVSWFASRSPRTETAPRAAAASIAPVPPSATAGSPGAAATVGAVAATPTDTNESSSEPQYRRVYFENFEERERIAGTVWLFGKRGDWKGSLVHGEYRLCNVSGSGTASFTSTLDYSEDEHEDKWVDAHANARLSMTVRLERGASKSAAAGVLFRMTEDRYSALALSAGHALMFVQSEGTRLRIVSTWNLDNLGDEDSVRLRIEGYPDEMRLFIGDKHIDTVADPGGRGRPGVFAMGRSCFRFDDVSLALPKL